MLNNIHNSTLPAFSAINASHKCGHGLICRTRLQLVVRAFRGTALGIWTSEVVGGRLHLGFVFVLVPQLFRLNECAPFIWIHVLMRHERQLMRLDLFACNHLNDVRAGCIHAHGAQPVGINLHEITIFPLFDNVFCVRFTQCVVIDAAFQIEGRICGCIRTHFAVAVCKTFAEFTANIFSELVRICNLQCSDGISVRSCCQFEWGGLWYMHLMKCLYSIFLRNIKKW